MSSASYPDESTLRRSLCDAARTLYDRGLIGPTDGNLSARLTPTVLLCTPSGSHKARLRPHDLVRLNLDGRVLSRGVPSSELKMHLAIYSSRPDVRCIVHAHPPCTVGLTVAGISLETPVVPEIIFALGRVPTVPYSSPTTADVPAAIAPVISHTNAFILARHGSVILCSTPDEGVTLTEVIEHTAKITLAAHLAGSATPLPLTEINKLLALSSSRFTHTSNSSTAPDPADVETLTRAVLSRLRT